MSNTTSSTTDRFYYLHELRNRILKCLAAVVIIFFTLFPFSQALYQSLAIPLTQRLPAGMSLIATSITSTFLVPVKLVALVSCFCAIPILLYQGWRFIGPALYRSERKWFWIVFIISTLLFYLGVIFAYTIVFPLLFKFLIQTVPAGVNILPDISEYLDFCVQMFLAFGLAFQVPLAVILLILFKIISVDNLVSKRPYIIVSAFVIGMIFAPPDVLSQILLAVPLWLLFEIGILLARWLARYQR